MYWQRLYFALQSGTPLDRTQGDLQDKDLFGVSLSLDHDISRRLERRATADEFL